MKPTSTRWTPIAKGDKYCSKGCGGGCTRADFEAKTAAAAALAAELGPDWEPRVCENLGWHYSAKHKTAADAECYPDGGSGYWVSLITAVDGTGQQFHAKGATPKEALGKAVKDAVRQIGAIQRLTDSFLEAEE